MRCPEGKVSCERSEPGRWRFGHHQHLRADEARKRRKLGGEGGAETAETCPGQCSHWEFRPVAWKWVRMESVLQGPQVGGNGHLCRPVMRAVW